MATRIYKERLESKTVYIASPRQNIGKAVIINISKCEQKERHTAESEVERLVAVFNKLKFESKVIRVDQTYSMLTWGQIQEQLREDKDFRNFDIFICVVLAYGGPGYFLSTTGTEKISLAKLIQEYKGKACPTLICKPKIFLVQTCNKDLEKIDPTQHCDMASGSVPGTTRIPIEADIMVYQSCLSGLYSKVDDDDDDDDDICSTFIKAFCDAANDGIKGDGIKDDGIKDDGIKDDGIKDDGIRFDLDDIILATNRRVEDFLNEQMEYLEKHFRPQPTFDMIPVCISQLRQSVEFSVKTIQTS